MSRNRNITPDTYGRALGSLVSRHNTSPDHLQARIAELEALVERQRQHIRELQAALADSPAPSVFDQRAPERQHTGGIPLTQWHKQNGMSYSKAYRLVSGGQVSAHQIGRQWFITED